MLTPRGSCINLASSSFITQTWVFSHYNHHWFHVSPFRNWGWKRSLASPQMNMLPHSNYGIKPVHKYHKKLRKSVSENSWKTMSWNLLNIWWNTLYFLLFLLRVCSLWIADIEKMLWKEFYCVTVYNWHKLCEMVHLTQRDWPACLIAEQEIKKPMFKGR